MSAIQGIQAVDLYFFAVLILAILVIKSIRSPNRKTGQSRAFTLLIVLTFLITVADCVTVVWDGHPGIMTRRYLQIASVLGFSLQVLICMSWAWYVISVIFPEKTPSGPRFWLTSLPALACLPIAVLSLKTGWLFFYDSQNCYHRGPLFAIIPILSIAYFFTGYGLSIRFRDRLDRRHFIAFISFALPPFIGGLVQVAFYGVNLLWPSMAVSLLIIYISIQNELILLDDLTGINNRRSLNYELRRRIFNARESAPFALMLIDVDNFKLINDRFGHVESDVLLREFAQLLRDCFRKDGFVARYGGDEFAVIVDLEQILDVETLRRRLQVKIDQWNLSGAKNWKLSVSVGSAPYLIAEKLNVDNFLVKVDKLLCLDKVISTDRRYRAARRA